MKMNTSKVSKDKMLHWRVLAFIFYIVGILVLQKVMANNLYPISQDYLKSMNLNQTYSKGVLQFFSALAYIGTITPYLIIMAFVYNFSNIYKSFILLIVIFNTYLFGGLLKLILAEPRPFFEDKDITNHDFSCNLGFGNPSGHSVSSTAFYLTLWHIIFESSNLSKKRVVKYISLTAIIIVLLLMFFGRFLSGTNSLDQIIFGFLLGFGIYSAIFFVMKVNVNDGIQFFTFMNIRNLIFFTANFLIFLTALLVYKFVPANPKQNEWLATVKLNANTACLHASESLNLFHQEAFLMVGTFLSNFFSFVGLKLEYYYSFNANTQNWKQYNFEKIEKVEDSLLSKISDIELQWNHTSVTKSIIRLVIILMMSMIILLPFFLVSNNQNIVIVFLFKYFLPLGIIAFSMFYLFKVVIKKFKLDNSSVFVLMND